MAFPISPSNGQTYKNYIYNSTANVWNQNSTGIYASGSNANGNYIQYSDGTMEQYIFIPGPVTSDHWVYYTWPVSFVGQPSGAPAAQPSAHWNFSIGQQIFSTGVGVYFSTLNGAAVQTFYSVSFIAIGRWK